MWWRRKRRKAQPGTDDLQRQIEEARARLELVEAEIRRQAAAADAGPPDAGAVGGSGHPSSPQP